MKTGKFPATVIMTSVTVAIGILAAILLPGCVAVSPQPAPMPLVLGERINKVKPGETITVPPLVPPAKQWYLIDDRGLMQWLDIDMSKPRKR